MWSFLYIIKKKLFLGPFYSVTSAWEAEITIFGLKIAIKNNRKENTLQYTVYNVLYMTASLGIQRPISLFKLK